ncbi:MAG: zinc ribbon domain-containing protein [Deltaproteobacteria bacterium]|nr:zinc ribbon domain-containing protein [Deltaproteobacteria bacterium]
MPLYEYECLDCGASIETLAKAGEEPKLCGFLCQPSPSVKQYGKGELVRKVSAAFVPGGEKCRLGKADKPTDKAVAKAGFSKYVNEGEGVYRKATGDGPDVIRRPADPE